MLMLALKVLNLTIMKADKKSDDILHYLLYKFIISIFE